MSHRVTYESVAERQEQHQIIRESAREIDEDTPLLRALFTLENGDDKHSHHGFGYVEKNEPLSTAVTFEISTERLTEIVELLENASAEHLGNKEDPQLDTIATQLTTVAETLKQECDV